MSSSETDMSYNDLLILKQKHIGLFLPDMNEPERNEVYNEVCDVLDKLWNTFANDGYYYHHWNNSMNHMADIFDEYYTLAKSMLMPNPKFKDIEPKIYQEEVDLWDKILTQPTSLAFIVWRYVNIHFTKASTSIDDAMYFYTVVKQIEETGEI